MKTIHLKAVTEVTIHDIKVLAENCEEGRKQALRFMLSGNLKRYLNKLVEIAQIEEELVYDLAA